MKICKKTLISTVAVAVASIAFAGCQQQQSNNVSAANNIEEMNYKEAKKEIQKTKYNKCFEMKDKVPELCNEQLASNTVLGQDLKDYFDARIDDQDNLFSVFAAKAMIAPPPLKIDENLTGTATGPMLSEPLIYDLDLIYNLDRDVNCITSRHDDRAVNIEKFKCFVEKYKK